MIYRNDVSYYKVAKKDYIKRTLLILVPSYLWAMFTIFIVLYGEDGFKFIITVTSIGGLFSICLGFIYNFYKWKKDFYDYTIEILLDSININGKLIKSKIDNKNINKITIDERNKINIHVNNKKFPLSNYIANKENLIDTLNSISKIEKTKNDKNYIEYLSIFFFCSLFLTRFIPDLRLYLIVAIGFILTTIISTFRYFIMPYKIRYYVLPVTINLFLLYIVSKYAIEVLNKILIS